MQVAAACGALCALITEAVLTAAQGEETYCLSKAMNGALTALVAITAPCGTVELWAAALIGVLAGWLYMLGGWMLERLRIDDAVDAIPVHLFGGAFGLLATGLFSSPAGMKRVFGTDRYVGFFYAIGSSRGSSNQTLLRNQIYALLFITVWVVFCMLPFFLMLNHYGLFRVTKRDELVGLDAAYHMAEMTNDAKKELMNKARDSSGRYFPHHRDGAEQEPEIRGKVVTFG